MALIADFLVAAAGFAAAFYCFLLSRRLKRFTALESGMGSAIAVLSAQVDDMTQALAKAKASSEQSSVRLDQQVARAEAAAARLEVLMASLHDIPDNASASDPTDEEDRRVRFVRKRPDRAMGRSYE